MWKRSLILFQFRSASETTFEPFTCTHGRVCEWSPFLIYKLWITSQFQKHKEVVVVYFTVHTRLVRVTGWGVMVTVVMVRDWKRLYDTRPFRLGTPEQWEQGNRNPKVNPSSSLPSSSLSGSTKKRSKRDDETSRDRHLYCEV